MADLPLTDPKTYLNEQGKFRCTKCGQCCRFVQFLTSLHNIPKKYRDAVDNEPFPEEFLNEHRQCIHLKPDMSCGIYSIRPKVCRIPKHIETDAEIAQSCANLHKVDLA